jgi:hypothetical protein
MTKWEVGRWGERTNEKVFPLNSRFGQLRVDGEVKSRYIAGMKRADLTILPPMESVSLRDQYLCNFVNTSTEHYQKYILKRQTFSDGMHYSGYLWDCIRGGSRITFERFCQEVVLHPEVCVFADDHSRDRVINAALWPYPPLSVAVMPPYLLLQLLPALPEDLYVCDALASWTLILTHEDDGKRRICWAVGKLGFAI